MPRASSRQPMEAAESPLPSEDTTPPVTKMYFADISASVNLVVWIGRSCGARLSIAGLRRGSDVEVAGGYLTQTRSPVGSPNGRNRQRSGSRRYHPCMAVPGRFGMLWIGAQEWGLGRMDRL